MLLGQMTDLSTSFRGAGEAREPGIQEPSLLSVHLDSGLARCASAPE
jgi:hypothetical protein